MRPLVILPKLKALKIENKFAREAMLAVEGLPRWRIDVWLQHLRPPSDDEMDRAQAQQAELVIGSEMAIRFFRDSLDQPMHEITGGRALGRLERLGTEDHPEAAQR